MTSAPSTKTLSAPAEPAGPSDVELAPLVGKLTQDVRDAVITMSPREARYLVDTYYQMQEQRKRTSSQSRAMSKDEEPHATIAWTLGQSEALELRIKQLLDQYSMLTDIGIWSRSIIGIGPVIAAGLMAHIDLEPWTCARRDGRGGPCTERKPRHESHTEDPCGRKRIETVGHIWRFAGLDPTVEWGKGEKRPWNARLRTLCWKVGESFVKVSGREGSLYGRIYLERKRMEIEKNERGDFADQAKAKLENFKIGKDKVAYYFYAGLLTPESARLLSASENQPPSVTMAKQLANAETGIRMLAPGHIHARSKRYAVKLFLSHWFETAYKLRWEKDPPAPYPLAKLGHVHKIEAPPMPDLG